MIQNVAHLVAHPRFRLALILLLMSGLMLACDDPWEPLPPWEH